MGEDYQIRIHKSGGSRSLDRLLGASLTQVLEVSMRILLADKLAAHVAQNLEGCGFTVHLDASLRDEALLSALRELQPEVLVVRSTKVTAEHLRSSDRLSLVIRAGAGINTIDLDAASRLGIFIANCPGKNAVAVAPFPTVPDAARVCEASGAKEPGPGEIFARRTRLEELAPLPLFPLPQQGA